MNSVKVNNIYKLISSVGTGDNKTRATKRIRLQLHGCANRPFYHVVLTDRKTGPLNPVQEQLGSYDPMANVHDEKLVALNYDRIKYWIGRGAQLTKPVEELLGLSGFLPLHPSTYRRAWLNRRTPATPEETKKE